MTAFEGTLSPSDDARAHAEALVRRSGTSFFWAMRMLPVEKRHAMFAIYAFCREVDDIADDPGDEIEKRARLAQWRNELHSLYDGRPRLPVALALVGPVERYGLHQRDFQAVIDGMDMDAGKSVRIADMDELTLYCDRVACAVGRLSNRVFGIDEAMGDKIAFALGQALQLTNILRDIHEDAGIDRLYLPAALLAEHGIDDSDLQRVLDHPALPGLCQGLGRLARTRFTEARALLDQCDRRRMRPAIVMMEVYHRILVKLEQSRWQNVRAPVGLSKATKLWVALRHGFV